MDTITVETSLQVPVHQVWESWTNPKHIKQWNFASNEWKCTKVVQQLEPEGEFSFTMEAKDGHEKFDFAGVYEIVIPKEELSYLLNDDRQGNVLFSQDGNETYVTVTIDAEDENSLEQQEEGWQNILANFKKHTETYFKK